MTEHLTTTTRLRRGVAVNVVRTVLRQGLVDVV